MEFNRAYEKVQEFRYFESNGMICKIEFIVATFDISIIKLYLNLYMNTSVFIYKGKYI